MELSKVRIVIDDLIKQEFAAYLSRNISETILIGKSQL